MRAYAQLGRCVTLAICITAVGCTDDVVPIIADSGLNDGADPVSDSGGALPPAGNLTLAAAGSSGVIGSFTFTVGAFTTEFSSTTNVDTGTVAAQFTGSDGSSLAVELKSETEVLLTLDGHKISGAGKIEAADTLALTTLGKSELGLSVALVALELGCKGQKNITDKEWAALLVPWQMLVKYDPYYPDTRELERESSCKYLYNPIRDEDQTASPAVLPQTLMLSLEDPIPHVFGIFPFDGEGAATKLANLSHNTAPCGADCRGACGPGCTLDNCTRTFEWYCVQQAGVNTGKKRLRTKYVCGSHAGCREHDSCYDQCNGVEGCGTWLAAICRRNCDQNCIIQFGISTCRSWMGGGGPFDQNDTYYHEHGQGSEQDDATLCPVPDGGVHDAAVADYNVPPHDGLLQELGMSADATTLADAGVPTVFDTGILQADSNSLILDSATLQVDSANLVFDGAAPLLDSALHSSDIGIVALDGGSSLMDLFPLDGGSSSFDQGFSLLDTAGSLNDSSAPQLDLGTSSADMSLPADSSGLDSALSEDSSAPPVLDSGASADTIAPQADTIAPQADTIAPQADTIAPQADAIAPQAADLSPAN